MENKSDRIFAFDKFTLQNLANKSGCVQTNLLYFLFITSEAKQYYEALYLSYRPRTECSISQFSFQDKLHSVNIQDDQSWAFSETVQKISKITHTASRFSLLTKLAPNLQCTLKELRFNIIKTLGLFFVKCVTLKSV